jgi:replication-associated recombination protein RarA
MTGTLAHTDTRSHLIAREEAHTSVVWPLLSGTTRLVLVTGAAGIGRTALLNDVRDTLEHHRVRTADVPLLRADRDRPQVVVARLKEELARWSRPPVLFLDDLHRLNHDVLRALLDVLPQLATCVVGSYRTPMRLDHTDLAETLCRNELIELVPLSPLNRTEVSHMFTSLLNVSADAELVQRVVRMVDKAEYKRRQYPPGPKISVRNFGRDRRLPITNGWRETTSPRSE